jgi:tetratricopeptide (TPR) repeat protein
MVGAGNQRDSALADIRDRVGKFLEFYDPALVAGPEASKSIATLIQLTADPVADPDAVQAAAFGAWLRYLVSGPGLDRPAFAAAFGQFARLAHTRPDRIPPAVMAAFTGLLAASAEPIAGFERWCSDHDDQKAALLLQTVETWLSANPPGVRAWSLARLAEFVAASYSKPAALDSTISALERSIELSADDDPELAERLNHLAGHLETRFAYRGAPVDLDGAVDAMSRAVRLCEAQPGRCAMYRSNLSGALQRRYERTHDDTDLDQALDCSEQAVADAPDDVGFSYNRAGALLSEYDRTARPEDLDEVIRRLSEADRVTPDSSPLKAKVLSSLGVALRHRFDATGHGGDLEQSIQIQGRAVTLTVEGDPELSIRLTNLSSVLLRRYGRTEELADLTGAVGMAELAVNGAPERDPNLGLYHSNVGGALRARYERNRAPADLDGATDHIAMAAALTAPGHPRYSMYSSNLGAILWLKYRVTRDRSALDAVVKVLQVAVDAGREGTDQHRLATALSNLGAALSSRYEATRRPGDLAGAVERCQEAVQMTRPDDPFYAQRLCNLASILWSHANVAGDVAHREEALEAMRQGAADPSAPISMRVKMGGAAGAISAGAGDWVDAAALLAEAVRLLPLAAAPDMDLTDQEYRLAQFTDLAADAAACALAAGDQEQALTVLESGRGVLLARALKLRQGVVELRAGAPGLAARFDELRAELDVPVPAVAFLEDAAVSPVDAFNRERTAKAERSKLTAELDALIEVIRHTPGLAGFLDPPAAEDLVGAASGGPIVLINVSEYRSDAVALTSSGVTVIPLGGP